MNEAVYGGTHRKPDGPRDAIALGLTKLLRFCTDTFFAKRYGGRAIVLEPVAAVPGMVWGTRPHLKCLRRMRDDQGWIATLIDEAQNARMHLMTFIALAKPTWFERLVVLIVRADEAHHRDTNHGFADTLAGRAVDPLSISAALPHQAQMRQAA